MRGFVRANCAFAYVLGAGAAHQLGGLPALVVWLSAGTVMSSIAYFIHRALEDLR